MIADYVCDHGVRHGDSDGGPFLWNGPLGTCECCGKIFRYLESGGSTQNGHEIHGTYWSPLNRCGRCGGGYKKY